MRLSGGISWLLIVAACGGGATAYPPAWVGTDAARRTTGTAAEARAEAPPRDTLMDEATLAYADGETACFDVTVRSLARDDAPLAGLSPRCVAGEGEGATAAPAEASSVEMLSVYDYDDAGDVVSTVTEDVPAESYAGEGDPAEGVHRVVERHARLCCAAPATERLVLSLGPLELAWDMR